jgi:hypothetical protein
LVIATGEILQHGIGNGQPRRGWDRPVWEDVSAAKGEKTPPEYVGKGLWEEWEHDAEINTATHKLSDPEWVVDSENKRLILTRTAVALTQAEIDARDAAATAAAAEALADARDAKWEAMKAVRESKVFSNTPLMVTVGGDTFGVQLRDGYDYANVDGLVLVATLMAGAGNTSWTCQFTDAANVVHELTIAQTQAMGLLVAADRDLHHAHTRNLRPIIYNPATTNIATINAITWEDGAPPPPE